MNKIILMVLFTFVCTTVVLAQRGYYDAPYTRYEANLGVLSNGAVTTAKSFSQADLQSEASGQICVALNSIAAAVAWNLTTTADGMVVRYSVPEGTTATIGIYNGTTRVAGLNLTSYWSWEYLATSDVTITNANPKKRFDEVRFKFPIPIAAMDTLTLVLESGTASIDFVEMELIAPPIVAPADAVTYIGNGSTLQAFIDAHSGQKIFIPTGFYSIPTELYFGVNSTSLIGAGMWYTEIHFSTVLQANKGGLRADASGISFSNLYLTTSNASRSNAYKGINGVFTSTSIIQNVWVEHFECGAWIAQYNTNGPSFADGFLITNCRFRNNFADGINLCKGTSNAVVEHCNFRNNGDDDQAIWSADGLECINNTFRYTTSENCWRASGMAIYGGKNNKAHHLLIRDNVEVGIRISNAFPGVGFNDVGLHELHDITISNCGTFNALFRDNVGAIAIDCGNGAGTQVKNVKFSLIDILDSKNDAISFQKYSGDGIYNLTFEAITINGTGKEFPYNNLNNSTSKRGYFINFSNYPNGNATYCNMSYSNRGGNALTNENTLSIGTFSWTPAVICLPLTTEIENLDSIQVFPNPASTNITIESTDQKTITKITISDFTGKMILTQLNSTSVNIATLSKGVYFLEVFSGEGKKVCKFVKE